MTTIANEFVRRQHCQEAVDLLLATRGWQLLEREAFVSQLIQHLSAAVVNDPVQAAIHIYSDVLYAACSGSEGLVRQDIGYTELFRYLYDIARDHYPDVCEEATQEALATIYTTFDHCCQPATFLAFALLQLLDAAKTLRRQAVSNGDLCSQFVESDHEALGACMDAVAYG